MLRELFSPEMQAVLAGRGLAQSLREAGMVHARRDDRARRFDQLESLINRKERALRLDTWAVPEPDRTRRVRATTRAAARRDQLAESARLAELRRAGCRAGFGTDLRRR